MQFSSSFMDTHKHKRARNGDEDDDPCGGFEIGVGVYKRHCSSSGFSELWRFDEQDFEQGEDKEDLVFACNEPQVFGVLREETADSESSSSKVYYNSEDFSPPFCRSSSSAYFLRFPVPDDAQSSTSDSCCCCCCDSSDDEEDYDDDEGNEGESSSSSSSSVSSSSLPGSDSTQNFISYLYEASDDDLGLPPALCTSFDDCKNDVRQIQSKVLEKHVQGLDLDLDVDLDLDFDLDLGIDDDHLLGWDL